MGQYYIIVNIDKEEYVHPHKLNSGMKLLELAGTSKPLIGLLLLLADGNGRGGGDADAHPLIGSWSGDRIVIAGDYADPNKFLDDFRDITDGIPGKYPKDKNGDYNLYQFARENFGDISDAVADMISKAI